MLKLPLILIMSALAVVAQNHPNSKKASAASSPKHHAQTAVKPRSAPKPAPAAPAQVTASQAVITLHGLCAHVTDGLAQPLTAKSASAPCSSKISKAAFEKLLSALPINQSLAPAQRRRLAQQYVELLTIAQAGIKAGEAKNPKLAQLEKFQHMQNMAQLYIRSLEEKYRTPSQAEIDAYYKANKDHFDQVTLQRVFIPRNNPATRNATPQQKSEWEAKAKKLADDMKARATKGEDMAALQKETYSTLALKMSPPNVNVGAVRKGALPAEQEKAIFGLKAGGVYESVEPTAFILYKVVSQETLTENAVKAEISRTLFQQKMNARKKEVSETVKADYNDTYFGPPQTARPMPMGVVRPAGAAKPAVAARPAGTARPKK